MQISCSRQSYFWLVGTPSHLVCCIQDRHWWCLLLCRSPEQQTILLNDIKSEILETRLSTHRNNSVPPIDCIWLPGAVYDVQHARLGRLGGGVEPKKKNKNKKYIKKYFKKNGVEPGGGGEVEPGVRHKVGIVEQQPALPEHRLAELPVVEIVTQLLRSSSVIFLELALPEERIWEGCFLVWKLSLIWLPADLSSPQAHFLVMESVSSQLEL